MEADDWYVTPYEIRCAGCGEEIPADSMVLAGRSGAVFCEDCADGGV
jgi:hypothetical protein